MYILDNYITLFCGIIYSNSLKGAVNHEENGFYLPSLVRLRCFIVLFYLKTSQL